MQDRKKVGMEDREGNEKYTAPRVNWSISEFEVVRRLGTGSCSTVAQFVHKDSRAEYAIKIIDKMVLKRNSLTNYIIQERRILDRLDYDGVISLKFTFQDPCHLYLGLELCNQGDLSDQILEMKHLSLEHTKFYAAEVVLILEYFRLQGIVHRDVKPENLVLTEDGHLKIVDFGCAKDLTSPLQKEPGGRRVSFVGTADYIAPEVLQNTSVTYATDLWGLGCLVYQMIVGTPPFRGKSEYLTYQNISNHSISFPADFPAVAKQLVEALLCPDPEQRLGAASLEDLKQHDFFQGICWETLRTGAAPKINPRSLPAAEDQLDWDLQSLAKALPLHYNFVENPSPIS